MEKEIPSTNIIQKGRKIKKVKIKVANKNPKKKYFSIIFDCIFVYCNKSLLFCKIFYNISLYMNTENKNEFAVIFTGGKQYKVSEGSLVSIEKIKGEYKKGDKITFDKVLLVDDSNDTTIGTPYIKGAKVDAEIVEIGRARKILVVKYKQKSRYLKRNGHRQPFFKVKITSIK